MKIGCAELDSTIAFWKEIYRTEFTGTKEYWDNGDFVVQPSINLIDIRDHGQQLVIAGNRFENLTAVTSLVFLHVTQGTRPVFVFNNTFTHNSVHSGAVALDLRKNP